MTLAELRVSRSMPHGNGQTVDEFKVFAIRDSRLILMDVVFV